MLYEDNYLAHFGIKGQKWGVRRFQNEDGSLTSEGKERYYDNKKEKSIERKAAREYDRRVKQGKFDDDPELKELYIMEAAEKHQKRKLNEEQILRKGNAFSEMQPREKEIFGDQVLDCIRRYKKAPLVSNKRTRDFRDVEKWLSKQIHENSGLLYDDPVDRSKQNRLAKEKLHNLYKKEFMQFKKIKGKIDRNLPAKEIYKELKKAINNDKYYTALLNECMKAEKDMAGVVLRDIGFNDTSENRKTIWPYIVKPR